MGGGHEAANPPFVVPQTFIFRHLYGMKVGQFERLCFVSTLLRLIVLPACAGFPKRLMGSSHLCPGMGLVINFG